MESSQNKTSTHESDGIKSTAVVKYSLPKPAKFMQLQCNTDLNLPPSNWLSSSGDTYGLQHVLHQSKGFSSFRMAHMFPDCVGEVDVVTDAENIKNLLKIPYHKGQVSMMVHRIENTLLLDDFDIYKHLLLTAETEWEWLRKFFYENIRSEVAEEDRKVYIKNRRRKALEQKNLVSKFLYHSIVESDSDEKTGVDNTGPLPVHGPLLPEPAPATEVPDPSTFDHKFNRNVIWTFEDIEMLIGTDMPIFGGGTHPCISLRLRDMSKPINVLTGIDYWLDNLMSNVPELVMCYHLNGIVQKYELVKTEDLPRMDNSKFSPKLIRDVAQSILSFLKSNATKAGHTYWLFKGKDEEVVKLYDLTSLCSQTDVGNGDNPFTVPVAMLLYRVARNMKHSGDKQQPGTIRMLLKNCVKLLVEEKYPEIVTSSHYMLSDLYVPVETNPESPIFEQVDADYCESFYDDDVSEDNVKESATKTLNLASNRCCEKFVNHYKAPPPVTGTVEERCLQAVHHVAAGLNCLKYFHKKEEPEKKPTEEEEVPMAKPYEPIPMPYAKLEDLNDPPQTPENLKKISRKSRDRRKKRNDVNSSDKSGESPCALLPKSKGEAQPLPTWQESVCLGNISWKEHLKILLYEKAVLVYAILSEHHYTEGVYGSSLRTIGLLVRCKQVMNKLSHKNSLLENCLLGRAGDCCIMMVQNWGKVDVYHNQFHTYPDEDLKMMEQLERDEQLYGVEIGQEHMKCVLINDIRTIEQMLLKGVECYVEAQKICETDGILRRLGNSLNEVGSFYLNRGKKAEKQADVLESCKMAEEYLKKALEVFEKVKDKANMALLFTNLGHLHRLLAHANTPKERGELTPLERLHYNKAFVNYKKALQVLAERKQSPGIWDAVNWELSTALFTMATIMLENPATSMSKSEVEKEVISALQKALQYCDLDENNPKLPLYQYRAAIIHYRLGSLYHNHIWTDEGDTVTRRNMIQLAKIHYEKAAKLYFTSADAVNYLTAQMQRFALLEFLAETASAPHTKIKHLQSCLEIILELRPLIDLIAEKKIEIGEDDPTPPKQTTETSSYNTCGSLLLLVKQRLQFVLRTLVKLCMGKPTAVAKDGPLLAETYKACYVVSFGLTDGLEFHELVDKLRCALEEIAGKVEDARGVS